jgi:hypothetical protein
MDFGDEHNDETFGAEATEIGTPIAMNQYTLLSHGFIGVDFDFSYNRNGGNGKEQRVLTVEELERQFQQQQQHHLSKSYASASGALPTARPLITQKLSVAELESQMLATSIKQPSPQPLVPQAIPPEHMAILQRIHQEDEEFKQRKVESCLHHLVLDYSTLLIGEIRRNNVG